MTQITIDQLSSDSWKAVVYDGPDGIDCVEFVCPTLEECFKQIQLFLFVNAFTYGENNMMEQMKTNYFDKLNWRT